MDFGVFRTWWQKGRRWAKIGFHGRENIVRRAQDQEQSSGDHWYLGFYIGDTRNRR